MNGRARLRAAVLGATGVVGQKLVRLLTDHPWFEATVLAASERSVGRRYGDVARWLDDEPLPPAAAAVEVSPVEPRDDVDVAFSALDAGVARTVEPAWAAAGVPVVSNASAFRTADHVPLLIPEVNADHLSLLAGRDGGFIVTNPNCATVGLTLVLAPLQRAFGVESVAVTTLQAVSGAGYPGVPALEILANALPTIPGEEAKLEEEAARILGAVDGGRVRPAPLTVSAQTFRVPVVNGHLLSLSLRLRRDVPVGEARDALLRFADEARLDLPSSPPRVLQVFDDDAAPQPRRHSGLGGGMTVSVGRLRRCPVNHLRCVVLVHNTMRGAAGAALLNAELLAAEGLLGDRAAGDGPRRVARAS